MNSRGWSEERARPPVTRSRNAEPRRGSPIPARQQRPEWGHPAGVEDMVAGNFRGCARASRTPGYSRRTPLGFVRRIPGSPLAAGGAGNRGLFSSAFVTKGSLLLCFLLLACRSSAADLEPPRYPRADRVDLAVGRGVKFLVANQNPNGSITDREQRQDYANPMTALGLMALAAVGYQPTEKTKEGECMRKAIDFLVRRDAQSRDPFLYFGGFDGSRMYGHGITTLALTEMLGMGVDKAQDALLRDRCQRAIDLILRSQRAKKYDARYAGGWRYTPDSPDSDLSITVWQVMALRSAKNAGISVPKEAIDMAIGYLKRSYYSPRDRTGKPTNLRSACGYEPGQYPSYATAAAGLLALQVCGEHDAPELTGSAEWLREQAVTVDERYFYYGTYYYSQAMQKRGGDYGAIARQITEKLLLSQQDRDGSWQGRDGQERGAGKVYSTALAILSLSVKYHFLPIYQE